MSDITGGCYCGVIRYHATEAPLHQVVCHCENCRRATGAQSVAFITVPAESFAFIQGEPTQFRTDTSATRTFCASCGSTLTYVADERKNHVDIHTGSLDHPESFAPTKDVFAEERLPWVALVRQE